MSVRVQLRPIVTEERYGFVATDRIFDDEVVLRLDLRGR